jgi:hypothetical protein
MSPYMVCFFERANLQVYKLAHHLSRLVGLDGKAFASSALTTNAIAWSIKYCYDDKPWHL